MDRSTEPRAALGVALTCLVHPASLGAVFCLLLNDHVLKGRAPALLTGKLSDFAGLFFFPFLMALVIGVSRAEPERIRRWAFGLTAAWFAAAKTTVLGHDLTLATVELLVGPSVIEPDGTDVVALIALVPAWHLWSRSVHAVRPSPRARVFATALAAAACLATSPTGPRLEDFNSPAVLRVAADGATVTAIVGPALSPEPNEGCESYRRERAGSWTLVGSCACPADHIGVGHREVTGTGGTRLRLAGEEDAPGKNADPWREYGLSAAAIRVIESKDGGVTWTTAWEISPTARVAASLVPERYHPRPDLRLVDLALSAESGRVAVAFRTEGALVREPDGTWLQEEVGPVAAIASTRTASVVPAWIWHLKWSGLVTFLLAFGALAPAVWLVKGGQRPTTRLQVSYASAYLVTAMVLPFAARAFAGGGPRPPPFVRESVGYVVIVACVVVAVSPMITAIELIRRRAAGASSLPRLRPSLALVAGLSAVALQAAAPFAGVEVRILEPVLAGAAFVAQAFLGWREASVRG